METIICYDTSIGTSNMGDYIIAESCNKQLDFLLDGNFVIKFPTHTPVSHWYQEFKKTSGGRYHGDAKYKFVFGTNLINRNMFVPTPTWNVNIFNAKMVKNTICVGVGLGSENSKPNFYTKHLLRKILSKEFIHSTRDEKTAEFLRGIGLKAINTGCVTTWGLNNEHCTMIPVTKSDSVIFTLTDYKKDVVADKFLIDTLKKCYKTVYFWIQGAYDYEYLKTITEIEGIQIVPPTLSAFVNVLEGDVDYVGTRLHAGIKAMQCKKRAIIIEVDNRASDMKECIGLPTIKRSNLKELLEKEIYSSKITKLDIHENAIKLWSDQFNENKK